MTFYSEPVEEIRKREYPQLSKKTYLDHAGTQLPPKSVMENFAQDLSSSIYGNPHSESLPAMVSGNAVDKTRERVLRFFNADPKEYDLIFVQNASAAVKLVAECFRDYHDQQMTQYKNTKANRLSRVIKLKPELQSKSKSRAKPEWNYLYHKDCHTSIVGVRELSSRSRCLANDAAVETWIKTPASKTSNGVTLFAYPGQSNMTGRRLPTDWCQQIQQSSRGKYTYTLLDAAALATTQELQLSRWKPDFAALSFYKIFGFPDLGALLVRKETAGPIMKARKYFGGGTVDMVIVLNGKWHAKKTHSLHEAHEDGTLPFHNIIALSHALDAMDRLYGGIKNVGRHTQALIKECYALLILLDYDNGQPLVHIYKDENTVYGNPDVQGATIAFSVFRPDGTAYGFKEIEKKADDDHIYVRSGALCNPGGVATYLGWDAAHLRAAYAEGHKCSTPKEMMLGRTTGVVRVSLGACSSREDVARLLQHLKAEYIDKASPTTTRLSVDVAAQNLGTEIATLVPMDAQGASSEPVIDAEVLTEDGARQDSLLTCVAESCGVSLADKPEKMRDVCPSRLMAATKRWLRRIRRPTVADETIAI